MPVFLDRSKDIIFSGLKKGTGFKKAAVVFAMAVDFFVGIVYNYIEKRM